MNRIWTLLLDARVIGFAALAAALLLAAGLLQVAFIWVAVVLGAVLLAGALAWAIRRRRSRRAGQALEQAINTPPLQTTDATTPDKHDDIALLRTRLQEAVKTIRGSKLGQLGGSAALYELPWYMVIGNPAAGKSSAIVRSGLQFPFADGGDSIIQGIGGTRNCDWFFTNQGILLDTAGRYSVQEEDRQEWLGFLALLKRHRAKAPINGIIIAASVAELSGGRPEQAIQLAKSLRQRVQELTEKLEVFAPVYLMFTKADLIAGFAEFHEDRDRSERDRVWGATLPYQRDGAIDALAQFDRHFDELHDGLKAMSQARMSLQRGQALPPGVLTFPLEFAALKPALRAFVATLFEDNPYQNRPIFRGFYFTSAVQEGVSSSRASERVARQFGLTGHSIETITAKVVADHGFFLADLFSKVIFADRELVRQFASRAKLRARSAGLALGVLALALALAGWSWAYVGNRQLMAHVQADLGKAIKQQEGRTDLGSRLEALETLQDRIEQLQRLRERRPFGIDFGLYQGEAIERRLMAEYLSGARQVMLEPVAQAIETYLAAVNADPRKLKPMPRAPQSGAAPARAETAVAGRYVAASVEDSGDAYNALKTYLMLADRQHLEAGHLSDQLTRFWRDWLDNNRGTMPREQMMRSAERMISFTTTHLGDPAFPQLSPRLALIDQTRDNLRELVRGMRGIERVYADVKARAATRYAPITVAGLLAEQDRGALAGSHAVPGPFTRDAWNGYIDDAFKTAASGELQSADWVLKTAARDDLTLEGSPEQIRKQLTDLYKAEYVREWQQFMQGVAVNRFDSFDTAVLRMNRIGDPSLSPIRTLMTTLFEQTSWDNPSLLNDKLASAQRGVLEWFKQTILRQAPSRVDVNVQLSARAAAVPMGPIGREFAPVARLMAARDEGDTLLAGYLQALSKLRTRLNQIKNQGDPGPGARSLMASTLDGGSSELSDALRYVDEQLLVGMPDSTRATLRPLLVRPLIEAMAVVVGPAETEINRMWEAQVYEPFQRTLAAKYPFEPGSRVEAGPAEIAKLFGPEGAIAKFSGETLGPLVTRRGEAIEPRSWAQVGVRLRPEFSSGFGAWVQPLDGVAGGSGAAVAGSGAAVATAPDQTVFQVLPQGAPGLSEYTLVLDGQTLRYRNQAAEWTNMVWPNPAGGAGARLSAVTHDGRSIELANEPGSAGVGRLLQQAQLRKLEGGISEMTWSQGPYKVTLNLRVLRQPGELAPHAAAAGSGARPAPVGGTRLQGVRLPMLVAGTATNPPPDPDAVARTASVAASGAALQ